MVLFVLYVLHEIPVEVAAGLMDNESNVAMFQKDHRLLCSFVASDQHFDGYSTECF